MAKQASRKADAKDALAALAALAALGMSDTPQVDRKRLKIAKVAFPDATERSLCFMIDKLDEAARFVAKHIGEAAERKLKINSSGKPRRCWAGSPSMGDAICDEFMSIVKETSQHYVDQVAASEFVK